MLFSSLSLRCGFRQRLGPHMTDCAGTGPGPLPRDVDEGPHRAVRHAHRPLSTDIQGSPSEISCKLDSDHSLYPVCQSLQVTAWFCGKAGPETRRFCWGRCLVCIWLNRLCWGLSGHGSRPFNSYYTVGMHPCSPSMSVFTRVAGVQKNVLWRCMWSHCGVSEHHISCDKKPYGGIS